MSENKLNLHMITEMQASFKLAEGRHKVQLRCTLPKSDGITNNETLVPIKLKTNEKQESYPTDNLDEIKKSRKKSIRKVKKSDGLIQHTKKKGFELTRATKTKNKKFERTINSNFDLKRKSVKRNMFERAGDCALPTDKGEKIYKSQDLKYFPKNNTKLIEKCYAKSEVIEYDSEQHFGIRSTNFSLDSKGTKPDVDKEDFHKTNGSKYSKDIHEHNFHVPRIFKLKQGNFQLNFENSKFECPCEIITTAEKYCWEKKFIMPAATAKVKKIYVYEDKNEILYSRDEQQEKAIVKMTERNSDVEKQDEFSEICFFENSLKDNYVLGVIKGSLEIYGTLIVTLLCGQMSVNGFEAIKYQPLTIYSPKGIYWVSIKTKKRKQSFKDYNINFEELNKYFSRAQLENILSKYNSLLDAIVLLQKNPAAENLLSIFNKNMNQNIFPQIQSSNRPYYQTEFLLNCLIQRALKATILQVPSVWNKLKLNKRSRLIVVGGKNVGKSSLVRYLINRNLTRFGRLLLIDLDIGQPEVFIPQTISCSLIDTPLLGPGFFLNKEPERAYVVGDVNIVMCVQKYITAIKQLMEYVHKNLEYGQIPWLINTMGYNKGFGLELIALIIQTVKPTDVVQISSVMDIQNFDCPLEWKFLENIKYIILKKEQLSFREMNKYVLHQLSTAVPSRDRRIWTMSSKDMRYSNLLARLSECIGSSKCLSDCQTFRAPLEILKILHPICKKTTREELIAGMEANVVYLAKSTLTGLPECLGIALVRAIDYEKNLVYLSPATSFLALSQVNCLILAGELTLPTRFFKDQGPVVANDVPFVFRFDDSKSSKAIQQIYYRASVFAAKQQEEKAKKKCLWKIN